MLWIIGGVLSLLASGGAAWLYMRGSDANIIKKDVAEEKQKAAEKHIEDIKDAKQIQNDIDRRGATGNRDRLRDRWTRKK